MTNQTNPSMSVTVQMSRGELMIEETHLDVAAYHVASTGPFAPRGLLWVEAAGREPQIIECSRYAAWLADVAEQLVGS